MSGIYSMAIGFALLALFVKVVFFGIAYPLKDRTQTRANIYVSLCTAWLITAFAFIGYGWSQL